MENPAAFDFIAYCRPGQVLQTRGRSEVTINRIDEDEGLIYGEVRMLGSRVWRRDGLFRDAPAGAAGPLDLVPPAQSSAEPRKTASMKDAFDPANRPFCCD